MVNEKITDFFVGKLLDDAKIDYTPNGSRIKEVQDALKTASKKGTGRAGFPEFTAKSKDFILVIEDKANLDNQANYEDQERKNLALDNKSIKSFAENGALHYAKEIIKKTSFKKVFAFGCTGNEKHHYIRPIYVEANEYKLLLPVENFENFSEENIEKYYREQVLGETPPEILETEQVIKKAVELHEMLRNYGQLRDTEKPLVVSAILLALCEKSFNTEQLDGDSVKTDGEIIFDALVSHMKRVKVEPEVKKQQLLNQFIIIKDRTILNKKDERLKEEIGKESYLEKTPLRYFTEYIEKNIIKAIKTNTSEDILGRFYGEFISYGGGDGQSLGVILTPKHITELFCDLIDLKPTDVVFDPCCGTGGFLISAMHKMLQLTDEIEEKQKIQKERLHGIEVREDMFAIASTNMILRGDGKSNLVKDDFLRTQTKNLQKKNYTVGFMNPPYSQAKGKDTAHLSEMHFIEHLLDSLSHEGKCIVIVPQSVMVGVKKSDQDVKKRILKKHTLEGVITLNKETFYRIGTNPCIAIFTAQKPHSDNKYCKFINYEDDGFAVRKHIGLIETERAKERKAHLINVWLNDAPAESKFMVKTTIEPEDEWLHSFYYFNDEVPKANEFEKVISDFLTFEFNIILRGLDFIFQEKGLEVSKTEAIKIKKIKGLSEKEWNEFYLKDIFPEIQRGKRLKKRDHIPGKIPYVSSTSMNNGIDDFIGNTKNVRKFSNCLSLANSGSVGATFFQPITFIASDHVTKLKNIHFNKYTYLFIAAITTRLREKYSFNREINDPRIQREKIVLPINEKNQPDYKYMEEYMKLLEIKLLKIYKEKRIR